MAPSWPVMPRTRRAARCRRPGKLLAGAARVDAADDARHGSDLPPAAPRTLARRAGRRERLAAARGRLVGGGQARRGAQRAKQEAWAAAAAAGKRRGRRRGGKPPRANRDNTQPRADTTGPEVRVMRSQNGCVCGCNGQFAVTGQQVIAAAMVSQHPAGRTLLHPLPDQCRDQLAAAGIRPKLHTVPAGSGSVTGGNFARAGQQKLPLPAPLAKDPATHRAGNPAGRRDLAKRPATARAARRMRHHRGRAGDKLRAQTAGPVCGQIKTCQKMTTMSRRGFGACRSQWLPAATAHNPPKLHAHRLSG
jgi:hypothetical protein